MKLEIGMYVRDKGTIKKIESIHKNCEGYKTEISLTKTYPRLQDYEIKKASRNIIDLIEVGDYVNGSEVIELYKEQVGLVNTLNGIRIYKKINGTNMEDVLFNDEIKEVLTHEQYNSNCYRIGSDE